MGSGESWETTSGLLDEYIMTFEEAWFAKPANYREGKQTVLQVRGVAYDPEDTDEILDDEKENFYSLGDGWEPDDGGEAATHGSGKTKFNENSSMGKLINHVVGLGDEVLDELKSRGESTEAATWRGLTFRIERIGFTFKDRKTGEENEYFVDLPVEFLGIDDDVDTGKGKAKSKSKSKGKGKSSSKGKAKSGGSKAGSKSRRKKKTDDEDEGDDDAGDDDLRAEVVQFAAQFEDHDDFMEEVLDPDEFDRADEVQDNEELLNDVIDEDGEIWEESRDVEPE